MNLALFIAQRIKESYYRLMDETATDGIAAVVAAAIAEHEKATPAIEPEYRMLEVGEIIERGDEYSNCEGAWNPVLFALIGDPLADFSVGHYRRKTTPIQPLLDNPHLGR